MKKKIYLLAGVSGVGKTTIICDLLCPHDEWGLVHKYTTRPVRPSEVGKTLIDNIGGKTPEFVNQCDWVYKWGEHLYGIKKQEIDVALKKHDSIVITVKDAKTIKDFHKHYKGQGVSILTSFVCPYITDSTIGDELLGNPSEFIERHMKQDNRTPQEIEERLLKIAEEYEKIWRGNEGVFDNVIMVYPNDRYAMIQPTEYAIFFDSALASEDYKNIGVALTKLEYGNPTPDERESIFPLLQSFAAKDLPVNHRNVRNLSLHLRTKRQLAKNENQGHRGTRQ